MEERENDLVSVIVPFYNSEAYLDRCIRSIVNQTYKNIELIMVNNASTDNSSDIAETFLKDNRVRLIDCNGKGVSNSRNEGLKYATGKWLLFADSDDYLEVSMIEDMMKAVSDKADNNVVCVETGYFDEDSTGEILTYNENNGIQKVFNKEEMLTELFESSTNHYQGYLWNKLLRLDIIKDNEITFNEDIYYNEDRLFMTRYFLGTDAASKVFYIPKAYYHYIHHKESAMGKIKVQPVNKVITEIKAFNEIKKLLSETGYNKAIEKLNVVSLNSCFVLLTTIDFKEAQTEKDYVINYLREDKATGTKYKIKRCIGLNKFLLSIYRALKNR